jgi:hypothetical protein
MFNFGVALTYDSFSIPVNKVITLYGGIQPIDLITLNARYEYDLAIKVRTKSSYSLLYSPRNKCWMLDLNRYTDQIETKYSFNLLFNFNNGFKMAK